MTYSNFKSPSFIQFNFLKMNPKIHVKTAGSTKQMSKIPHHIWEPPSGIADITPRGPTRPQVPIPEPIGTFSR